MPAQLRSPRPFPTWILLIGAMGVFAAPTQAAVFKCQDAAGHTSYQGSPCPGGGGETDVRVQHPSPAEEGAARQRSEKDKAAARELEHEQEKHRQEALREDERRDQTHQAAQARCAKYREDAAALGQRSLTRKKPQERERDERKAEQLRSRHFSECFVAGR